MKTSNIITPLNINGEDVSVRKVVLITSQNLICSSLPDDDITLPLQQALRELSPAESISGAGSN